MDEDLKGDLEVIVNYMGLGLMKTKVNDVKIAEMPVILRDSFTSIFRAVLDAERGKLPKNAMPLFSDEQFKQS